jgi:HEAT repeat protein
VRRGPLSHRVVRVTAQHARRLEWGQRVFRRLSFLGPRGRRRLESLIQTLADENGPAGAHVMEALVARGRPAVRPLVRALQVRDRQRVWHGWPIREGAAAALGGIGDRRAVGPLITALSDLDLRVRSAAAHALAQIGGPAVDPLIAALENGGVPASPHVALALGLLGDIRAVDPLVATLEGEGRYLRAVAAQALWELKDTVETPSKIDDLAVQGLMVGAGFDRHGAPDAAAIARMAASGDFGSLLKVLAYEVDWRARLEAVGALSESRPDDSEAVALLLMALRDVDERVGGAAAWILGGIGAAVEEPLLVALHDRNEDVRSRATRALGLTLDRLVEDSRSANVLRVEDLRAALGSLPTGTAHAFVQPLIKSLKLEYRWAGAVLRSAFHLPLRES